MHKLSSTSDTPASESRGREPKVSSLQPPQSDSDCTHQQLVNSQHKKKKSKKHKDKERERLKDSKDSEWSPDLKQKQDKLDSKALFCVVSFLVTDVNFSFLALFEHILMTMVSLVRTGVFSSFL